MAEHVPVLLEECIEMLNIRPDGIYLDGTLGLGGHSAAIAARLAGGRLIGIDRDETALQRAGERLKPWKEHVTLVHSSFGKLDAVLEDPGRGGEGIFLPHGRPAGHAHGPDPEPDGP